MLPFAGSPWVLPVLSGLREHFQNARKRVRKGSQDAFQILILPPPSSPRVSEIRGGPSRSS